MTEPLVSVLCATYNHRQFLPQCLDAILAQLTDFPVELLLHDDASTDGTDQIVREYADRYPGTIRATLQTENQHSRHRKARLTLLNLARGRFIAVCDGDDVWFDQRKLQLQVDVLQRHPEAVLCYHPSIIIDGHGEQRGKPIHGRDFSPEALRVLAYGLVPLATVMHRRVLIDQPPEFNLVVNTDNFLPMLLAQHGGAVFIPEIAPSGRRVHDGSVFSSQSELGKQRMLLQSYLQIAAYFLRIGEYDSAIRIIEGKLSGHLGKFVGSVRGTTAETP